MKGMLKMIKKIKIGILAGILVIIFVIGFGIGIIILNEPNEPNETPPNETPPNPPEPIDPYIKGWSMEVEIVFIDSSDYFVVNYNIPKNYTYRYCITEKSGGLYIYAVSSEMFEEFKTAVREGYIWTNPIIERVYQFEMYDIYSRFRVYGNFISPCLDNWYIFYCGEGGRVSFNFADAIFDRIIIP